MKEWVTNYKTAANAFLRTINQHEENVYNSTHWSYI